MDIRRSALLGSLCILWACGSDRDQGPEWSGETTPPQIDPGGPISGAFGGTVGGTAGGFGGFGGVGPNVPAPARLSELVNAEQPPRPISGGTLAVAPNGSYAVAADPDIDTVYVVDTGDLRVTKVELPAGSDPGRVALDAAGSAHVVLRGSGTLLRIELATGRVAGEATLCTQPRGLAYDAARDALVAGCMDGDVVTLKAADYAELSRRYVASDLRDVVVSGGRLYVSRYRSAELLALDSTTGALQATNRPRQARATRFAGFDGLLADVNGVAAPESFGPREITFSPTLAWRAAAGTNGEVLMLHQQSQNEEVFATPGGYGSKCAPITKGAVTRFAPDGTPRVMSGIELQGLSVDLAQSPAGDWIAVASPGGYVLGAQTLQLYSTAVMIDDMSQDFCAGPAWVGGTSSQVVAVAFDGQGQLYSFSREPVEFEILSLSNAALGGPTRVATLTLDRRSVRDTGHDLFHADVGSGLSCASCHGEALDDGHVWTFAGIGPRRTQNMRGGLLATAPFHWDGDMTSFRKLVDDVMTGRMGGFPISDSYAEALARWIDKQPALRLPGKDAAAIARGKTLFNDSAVACATCHSGDALTNNQSADVGTGSSLQVPSLRGLGLRAPYMHDGCAQTIEARFDAACGGGDRHGKTSHLDAAQIADLSAYLRTL